MKIGKALKKLKDSGKLAGIGSGLTQIGSSVTAAARANEGLQNIPYSPESDSEETKKRGKKPKGGAQYIDAFRSKTSNNGSINDNEE